MMGFLTLLYYKFTAEFPLKEFLKSVSIWQSYRQKVWLPQVPCAPAHCPGERWTCPRYE